ncbi:MAG: slipin family protein [Actinobacteria bacterium]|nr:slipin family protein [Actinomycetota bacterium]MCG2801284.1 slipin family protein [Cellulomonas sp.]
MRIVVQEWERVLVYRDGRFERELGPGRHRVHRWRRRTARLLMRPRLLTLPTQEMLTGDGLAIKVGLTSTVRVTAARAWHEAVEDPDGFLYAALQLALREAVADHTLDELLGDRAGVADRLRTTVEPAAAALGMAVDRLAVRDLVVPAELRRSAADAAAARAQGLVALERARAEVATMRTLANAAALLDSRPGLLALRTLQAVEAGGATVVLTADPAARVTG